MRPVISPIVDFQKKTGNASKLLGFSLPELLIVSAIGALAAITLSTVYSGFVRERARLEMYQKAVNDWERINRMIETDVTESRLVVLPGVRSCAGATSSFDLWVNKLGNTNASAASAGVISYSLIGGNLWRCGPPVCSVFANCPNPDGSLPTTVDGRLDFTSGSSSEALVGVGLSFVKGDPRLEADGSLGYGFVFSGLNGASLVEFSSLAKPSAQWINQCAFASSSSC